MTPVFAKAQAWLRHPLSRHPLGRRIIGYSAGSVVAVVISELCFAAALGWGHTGTTVASAAGFAGGAVPNYILNRRWAWRDRRGRDRRSEITLYMVVALAMFVVSAVVTHWAEAAAKQLVADRALQVILTALAYLGVSGLFFVIKFVIYEVFVFTKAPEPATGAEAASSAAVAPSLTQAELPVTNGKQAEVASTNGKQAELGTEAVESAV